MTYTTLHMTIRIILLVTVVFFSSGFTTIVKYCSMSQSSECCCCESDHSDNAATQSNEPSINDQNSSCLTVKVIGGLNEIKATVTSESSETIQAIDAVPFSSDIITLPTPTHSLALTYSNDIAPPNGDICIRISSLLI
jgi:hypothetical protein